MRIVLLIASIIITLYGCKKDQPIANFPRESYGDVNHSFRIYPANNGTLISFGENDVSLLVWKQFCDSIEVYNTNTGVLSARFIQPGSPSNPFQRVMITVNSQYVVTQRDPDQIKLYSISNNAYVRDLERVWDWIVMPDNNSILGFDNSLIGKTGVKKINFNTGVVEAADTFQEMNSPVIAGTRNNGTSYILLEFIIDLNNMLNPKRHVNVLVKNLQTHQIISEYQTTKKFLNYNYTITDDGNLLTFVEYDSASAGYFHFTTLETVSGVEVSSGVIEDVNAPAYYRTTGPGMNQIIFTKFNTSKIYQAEVSPTFNYRSHAYVTSDVIPNGFVMIDASRFIPKIAASYLDAQGDAIILIWEAKD